MTEEEEKQECREICNMLKNIDNIAKKILLSLIGEEEYNKLYS